jgi:transposase
MLRPMPIEPIPPDTARVARAAFPKGNRYLRLADELDMLFTDDAFPALFPTHGQPALPPWRLALVTLLPFAEGLSDRQAAEAVRSRIDWQYMRHLELTDPGFDASVLSAFRTRLSAGAAAYLLFDTWLAWCRDRRLVKSGGRQARGGASCSGVPPTPGERGCRRTCGRGLRPWFHPTSPKLILLAKPEKRAIYVSQADRNWLCQGLSRHENDFASSINFWCGAH